MRKADRCEEEGCEAGYVIECRVTVYRHDVDSLRYAWWLLRRNGLRWFWRLLRDKWNDDPDWYCSEHAQKNGYCRCCGDFWAGIESYDFLHPGLCDNCYDQIRDDFDEWDEDEDYWEPDYTLDELEWQEAYPELVDEEEEL